VRHDGGEVTLTGPTALRLSGNILAAINLHGGSRNDVDAAVGRLEASGGPERLIAACASQLGPRHVQGRKGFDWIQPARPLRKLPAMDRLALEMATHEENERRAMEGELAELEAAWRDAEEIAAIADSLLLPARVENFVREKKSP
jgi:hypothetical protein